MQDGSVLKFYEGIIFNNFAVQSSVIQSTTEGYFEMYNWKVYNNYALSLPVARILIVNQSSIIDNWTFRDNIAYSKQYILSQLSSCTDLCFFSDAYRQFLQKYESSLNIISIPYTI